MQYFIFYNYFLLFHFPSDRLLPSSFETLFGQFHFWGQIELQTLSAGWSGFKYIATHNRPDDDQVMLVVMIHDVNDDHYDPNDDHYDANDDPAEQIAWRGWRWR